MINTVVSSSPSFYEINPIPATAVVIREAVKRLPSLAKLLSRHNQELFSTDLSLVGLGIRTGYLLDLCTPKDPVGVFTQLLSTLRSDRRTKDFFDFVVHIFEPSSEQSFFVNAKVLSDWIPKFTNGSHKIQEFPVFIHLGSSIELLQEAPSGVLQLLGSLLPLTTSPTSLPSSLSLPINTTIENAVPLAAMLLDYQVAYVPSPSHESVLSGIFLDFYECILSVGNDFDTKDNGSTVNAPTISKFSCPCQIAGQEAKRLQPENIMVELKEMYVKRLRRIGAGSMEVRVLHNVQVLDHVAL